LSLFLFVSFQSIAQVDRNNLTGDWKVYLSDKISFEFLQLNADGTGIKCFGQTIAGKDTLFLNHFSALYITDWKVKKGKLLLVTETGINFKANPEYKLSVPQQGLIELEGQHLKFDQYPSQLNRKDFQRTVRYQQADLISEVVGVEAATCIVKNKNLFTFEPIDSITQIARHKGLGNLIPYLVGCKLGYLYAHEYNDVSYTVKLLNTMKGWSFGFGNQSFYISFDTDKSDKGETSIVIYYDFDDHMKKFFFSQIAKGKEKEDIVKVNGRDIYKSINWQGKYSGMIFLENSIAVGYYTKDDKLEAKLQECITSFNQGLPVSIQ
jgi:hypothetical protein